MYFGLPGYGGGKVDNDWQLRSEIERNNPEYDNWLGGVGASIPGVSKLLGLSDKFMGEEYFEHRSGEDLAGTMSSVEGQLTSIVAPILTNAVARATKMPKHPWAQGALAVTTLGEVAWGMAISRNAESHMEAGDTYWQKLDSITKAYKDNITKTEGQERELTRAERNNLAIIANEGIDTLIKKNQALGGADLAQFLLTWAKIPAIGRSFNGIGTKMLGQTALGNVIAVGPGSRLFSWSNSRLFRRVYK